MIINTLHQYSDQEVQRIALIIQSNLYFQSGTRDFTVKVIENLTEMGEQWAHRFQMIVDELCNNAIEFGSQQNEEILVTFYIKQKEWFEVVVEDHGHKEHPMTAAALTELVERRKNQKEEDYHGLRGRGLAKIVASWTDELEFKDRPEGGIIARGRKYLKNI